MNIKNDDPDVKLSTTSPSDDGHAHTQDDVDPQSTENNVLDSAEKLDSRLDAIFNNNIADDQEESEQDEDDEEVVDTDQEETDNSDTEEDNEDVSQEEETEETDEEDEGAEADPVDVKDTKKRSNKKLSRDERIQQLNKKLRKTQRENRANKSDREYMDGYRQQMAEVQMPATTMQAWMDKAIAIARNGNAAEDLYHMAIVAGYVPKKPVLNQKLVDSVTAGRMTEDEAWEFQRSLAPDVPVATPQPAARPVQPATAPAAVPVVPTSGFGGHEMSSDEAIAECADINAELEAANPDIWDDKLCRAIEKRMKVKGKGQSPSLWPAIVEECAEIEMELRRARNVQKKTPKQKPRPRGSLSSVGSTRRRSSTTKKGTGPIKTKEDLDNRLERIFKAG